MELHEVSLAGVLIESRDVHDYTDLHPQLVRWGDWVIAQLNDAHIDFIQGWGVNGDGEETINITFMANDRYDTAGSIRITREGTTTRLCLVTIELDSAFNKLFRSDMSELTEAEVTTLQNTFMPKLVELIQTDNR